MLYSAQTMIRRRLAPLASPNDEGGMDCTDDVSVLWNAFNHDLHVNAAVTSLASAGCFFGWYACVRGFVHLFVFDFFHVVQWNASGVNAHSIVYEFIFLRVRNLVCLLVGNKRRCPGVAWAR